MKKWWKRLEWFLEGISYRKRIVGNLALCAFMGLLIWSQFGYPLPTAEMEFRRYERTHLLPRSELVFRSGRGEVTAADGTQLHFSKGNFAGLCENLVTVANVDDFSYIRCRTYPLEEGPTLVPLAAEAHGGWSEEVPSEDPYRKYDLVHHHFSSVLLVNVPRETARAEITVVREEDCLTSGGWDLGNGVWLLGVGETYAVFDQPGIAYPYTLRLYRADGSLLLEKSGQLGEG